MAPQRETILQQFRELKATFLLFMKNLRRVRSNLRRYRKEISYTAYSIQHQKEDQALLKRETLQDGEMQEHTQCYHITRLTATIIPKSEN
jgi:isochorismate hydrolase